MAALLEATLEDDHSKVVAAMNGRWMGFCADALWRQAHGTDIHTA